MATKHGQVSNWRNDLLPHVVDRLAKLTPSAPYALYPNSPTTYDEGFRIVTYKDFANAINGIAWWLTDVLGRSENFDVVAYIGPNDIRYTAFMFGALKAGYVFRVKAFFTSPRNSLAAHGALFEELKCRTMLTPSPAPPAIEHILGAHPMKHLQIPSVSELLDQVHAHYPYHKTFEESRMEPLLMLHTSGSTGIPKPLIWTHESAARHSNYCASEPPPGFQSIDKLHQGKRMLNTFPPFHGACVAIHIVHGIPFGTVSIASLSGVIPTAEGVVEALKHTDADVAFLVPSILSDLSQKPELLDYCAKQLELVLYAGGDLPQPIGDRIASRMHMRCQYGASELGLACQLIPPNMTKYDWHYICFHANLGLVFEEVTPGLFEMVVKRDPKYEANQLPFTIGPSLQDLEEYRTKDLFAKHPTIPNCWGWRARADDIIVFLNGEKTNPISMEQHVFSANPSVTAALVVGMQRFQASLIVEPTVTLDALSTEEASAFINDIWPSIDEANKVAPAHARVEKSMVLLTGADKPMIRSGKGTIQRQATVTQYENEINDLYAKADIDPSGVEKASIDTTNLDQVRQFLQQVITNIEPELLGGNESFFALGMDSLMAMRITRALRQGLGRPKLEVSVVYNNPSVESLTRYLVESEMTCGPVAGGSLEVDIQSSEMSLLVEEYQRKINNAPRRLNPTPELDFTPEVVLLTGSTGSLGSTLLETMLLNPAISHVYCLNRRENAKEIHEAKARNTGFPFENYSERVSFIHVALDKLNLGLDDGAYERLYSEATLIIHNAWAVNFMMSLENFRPQFEGLNNLFQLASACTHKAKILFISSISAVTQLRDASPSASIPEEIVTDLDAPFNIGYGKSKLIAELLCDNAARHLNIPTFIARVGQIAGPVLGSSTALWNTAEWLPSLVLTSLNLGALPESLGVELNKVDWMPVDLLAKVLVELRTSSEPESSPRAKVFNLVNPNATSWEEILPVLVSCLEKQTEKRLIIVPARSWLANVRKIAEDVSTDPTELARKYPASKLQEFYEERMLESRPTRNWTMSRAKESSEILKNMPAVGDDWIEKWVSAWVDWSR